jgi:hypothetical protein
MPGRAASMAISPPFKRPSMIGDAIGHGTASEALFQAADCDLDEGIIRFVFVLSLPRHPGSLSVSRIGRAIQLAADVALTWRPAIPLRRSLLKLLKKAVKVLEAIADKPRHPDNPRTAPFSMPTPQCRYVDVQHPGCGLLIDNKRFRVYLVRFHNILCLRVTQAATPA